MKKLVFLMMVVAVVGLVCGSALAQNLNGKRIAICHNDYDPCADPAVPNDDQGFVIYINASGWGGVDGHQVHPDKTVTECDDFLVTPGDSPAYIDCVIFDPDNLVDGGDCTTTSNPIDKKSACTLN